jgi:protoheme IX farnesyltransferase
LLATGAFVSASGGSQVCQGWLLCNGQFPPSDLQAWIHFLHRLITFLVGILFALTFWQAWKTQRSQTGLIVSSTAVVVLFLSQALMGSVEAARGFPAYLLGLHTATAVAVWVAMVIQVIVVGLAGRTKEEEAAEVTAIPVRRAAGLSRDFLMLTKPVVVVLLLVTTFAGWWLAPASFKLAFWTLLAETWQRGGSGYQHILTV